MLISNNNTGSGSGNTVHSGIGTNVPTLGVGVGIGVGIPVVLLGADQIYKSYQDFWKTLAAHYGRPELGKREWGQLPPIERQIWEAMAKVIATHTLMQIRVQEQEILEGMRRLDGWLLGLGQQGQGQGRAA